MRRFLLLPHLRIHNANAVSSPFTIGFPAMTAWLGAVHALQRHLWKNGFANLKLGAVAVSCHYCDVQTYRGDKDYVNSIVFKRYPLVYDDKYKKKYGNQFSSKYQAPLTGAPFVEEGRCHVDVSLLIELHGYDSATQEQLAETINRQILRMKWASGDLNDAQPVEISSGLNEDDNSDLRKLRAKLMLGHVLVERRDLMQEAMANEGLDALDALLDYLTIKHRSTVDDKGAVTWSSTRKAGGWLVPIAVGYQGISDLGQARHQRDPDIPHRFAESVVTLGEFVMPHRIHKLDDMLWAYHYKPDQQLYLCQTLSTLKHSGE